MSDINLIDLSIDDEETNIHNSLIAANKNEVNVSSIGKPFEVLLTPQNCDFVSPLRRDSLENNPFDLVQKQANRPSDPFDLVESQARHCSQNERLEVKVANLLSLSNDDMLNEDEPNYTCESSSNLRDIFETKMKETEARKRLLKFSITNSTFNTPTGRNITNSPIDSGGSEDSPLSHLFRSAISHCSAEPMISAESPLKFVDDDLMCETPPSNSLETDFDEDLKMLTIPMLKDMSISALEEKPTYQHSPTVTLTTSANSDTIENLELLRAKLRVRRSEKKFNNDITGLIQNLKSLICNSDLADKEKKHQASSMLETLSKTLAETQVLDKIYEDEKKTELVEDVNNILNVPTPPPSIKRQGTFDMNLLPEESGTQNTKAQEMEGETVVQQPEAMISSTATYDGESAADKMGLELPEIEVPVPNSELQHSQISPTLDINDIVEQLNKLLNMSNFPATSSAENIGNSQNSCTANACNNNNNPTYIVVMPTTNANANVLLEQSFNQDATSNNEVHAAGSRNVSSAAQAFRRRSQSLSLHDKLKIVQLPITVSNLQQSAVPSPVSEYTPPSSMPIHMLEAMGRDSGGRISGCDADDFKTPARMLRRNSYSSGTPYTPMINHGQALTSRRSNVCNEIVPNPRRSISIMEKQVDKQKALPQKQSISTARSATLQARIDLKKKHNKTESIMKSVAPMKATIPLRKIMAPTLKTSPPTPNRPNLANKSYRYQQQSAASQHLDNSMHFLGKSGQIALTSTPMPLMHDLSAMAAEGPLSFCSTPHVGPNINRTNMVRPRLSYAGSTPTSKATPTASAVAAGLSRRTLNELKHKSPIKTHTNNMGAVSRPYASGRNNSSIATTTSSTKRYSATASTRKPVSRLRPPVHSVTTTGSGTSIGLNKENKRP